MANKSDRDTSAMLRRRVSAGRDDSQAEGYFADAGEDTQRRPAPRIVSVPLGQIWPDRYQPRPILPPEIKVAFYAGRLNWYEAAEAWLQMAKEVPAVAERVEGLLSMGNTFDEHGQIKPATGSWQRAGGQAVFYLETGERRFWAKALQAVVSGAAAEPLLEVREIVGDRLSRARQVIENIHAEKPTAVARAREIASLILSHLELHPDPDPDSGEFPDEYDYYRTVLEIKRMPPGLWDEVGEIMGLSRSIMTRHLDILRLPDQLQDVADLYRISERVLREIVALPDAEWEQAIEFAIEESLTAVEMQSYAETVETKTPVKRTRRKSQKTDTEKAASRIWSLLKLTQKRGVRENLGEIATEFTAGAGSAEELHYAADIFEELARHLRLRAGD